MKTNRREFIKQALIAGISAKLCPDFMVEKEIVQANEIFMPDPDAMVDLGSRQKQWNTLYSGTSGLVEIKTGTVGL